jgi:hypothetical protein
MLETYYLMQAAVAAWVERVVMAGSNCALAIADMSPGTKDAAKTLKEVGEAFHTCLLTGVQARHIPIH